MFGHHLERIEEARQLLPDNFKVEFSGDVIVMQASPSGIHQRNLALIQRQFEAHAPDGYLASGNSDLESPAVGKLRNPDLTYLPEQALETTANRVPADRALIAVEIVSPSNPENDWQGKVRDYPQMGIPAYLIVDPNLKTVTLFTEPENGRYRVREDADFGETIHIPAPFGFVLETNRLMPY
jgi:Uma2 family endonuclease